MKIAYALQNAGAVKLSRDFGASVPLKATLRGLEKNGQTIEILALRGRRVVRILDLTSMRPAGELSQGLTGLRPFQYFEQILRAVQRMLAVPYFAFFDSVRFYSALRRVLPGYDLCHEHNGLFSVGAAAACTALRKPYVLTFDADLLMELDVVGKPLKGIHRGAAEHMAAYSLHRADRVLCVSEAASRQLVEKWRVSPDKIRVLPNGVDTELFRPPAEGQALERTRVAFVGAFQPWHGLDLLVEAFAGVLKEVPYAELLLIGGGPARKSVDRAINAQGIASKVHITGIVPQHEVPGLLAGAAVAVLPYPELSSELWFSPLKLYEYMAAGKAIVASNAGQIADVIDDGRTGVLVEPGNVPDLTRAIVDLLQDPSRRLSLGQAARRQAVEKHSWAVNVRRLEEIYREVLMGSGSVEE